MEPRLDRDLTVANLTRHQLDARPRKFLWNLPVAVRQILARVTGRGSDTMPIDVLNDELISLSEAARRLPNQPSPATFWRWHRRGVNGVRLEIVRIGGRIYTTSGAWQEFVRKSTDAGNADSAANSDSSERPEATHRKLIDAGLLKSPQGVLPVGFE